jgi:hypothetical protein
MYIKDIKNTDIKQEATRNSIEMYVVITTYVIEKKST